jgi:hypothetical protein
MHASLNAMDISNTNITLFSVFYFNVFYFFTNTICIKNGLHDFLKILYKIHLMEAEVVRWKMGGAELADNCTFSSGNGDTGHHLGTHFLVHNGIISAVMKAEFINDRMSYIILEGCWSHSSERACIN